MSRPRRIVSWLAMGLWGCAQGPGEELPPRFVPDSPDVTERVESIAREHLAATDVLDDVHALRERSTLLDVRNVAHVRLDQLHADIEVLGGQAIVHVPADNRPVRTTDRLLHDLDVDTVPVLDEDEAIRIAREHAGRPDAELEEEVELVIVREEGVDHLTWHVALRDVFSDDPARPVAYVDAHTGQLVLAYDNLQTARDRRTYDARVSFSTPVRTENQAPVPGNAPVNDCHDLTGTTWDYYDQFHNRDSFDGAGGPVLSAVELGGPDAFNAFWDGTALYYGNGGGGIGFGQVVDVVAHEFTHAVTQYTADLIYSQQSGGLNEASSDIMGAVVESWDDGWNVSSTSTWLVGEDFSFGPIRSMVNPTQYGAISSFNQYNNNLGVHTTSGIANRAFVDWVSDPAVTIEEGGEIWYTALSTYMTPRTTFAEARLATQQAAIDLHGPGAELNAVADGWDLVDVPGLPAYSVFDDVGPITLATGQQANYTFTTSPNALAVLFTLVGRNGNADLYVSRFGTPTLSSFDCRSARSTQGIASYESCDDDPATPGTYQVMVRASSTFSGAMLYAWEAVPGGLCPDADGDGYTTCDGDCDDSLAAVNPGAAEVCNNVDDDCDGTIDGANATGATAWYVDGDNDGYGDPATEVFACTAPAGTIATGDDCDDGDEFVSPGADEICNTIDDDCDGTIDGPDSTDALPFYIDSDEDGYGNPSQVVFECAAPAGTVPNSGDCDDVRAAVNPGATEVCNSRDDDCDGTVDGATAQDAQDYYVDGDTDGYGDPNQVVRACQRPAGTVVISGDCDDGRTDVNPGATERCNGRDDDCDGATDPSTALGAGLWYRDGDSDGYGDGAISQRACDQPSGFVDVSGDCNDILAAVNPGALEVCNGFDDNCDSVVDPPSSGNTTVWYLDGDSDGFGNAQVSITACAAPTGYVSAAGDCNDLRNDVFPGGVEVCDPLDVDEDCDGVAEEPGAQGEITFWLDDDDDGFGDPTTEAAACDLPPRAVAAGGPSDCDDANDAISPDADEVCDGVDQDCDGTADDDAIDFSVFYVDADGDGFGLEPVEACEQPPGTATVDGDCDDADAGVNPDADEIPNDNIDQDCDGSDLRDPSQPDPDPGTPGDDPDPGGEGPDGPGTDRNNPSEGLGCSTSGNASFPVAIGLLGALTVLRRRRRRFHEG